MPGFKDTREIGQIEVADFPRHFGYRHLGVLCKELRRPGKPGVNYEIFEVNAEALFEHSA